MGPARANLPHDYDRNRFDVPEDEVPAEPPTGTGPSLRSTKATVSPSSVPDESSVISGSLWMMGVSLALFFLPPINGLIGGAVGGYRVGSMRRALMAAVLPTVVVASGLWLLLTSVDMPIVGLFAGLAMGVHILLSSIGLLIGAAIGGAVAQNRIDRLNRA